MDQRGQSSASSWQFVKRHVISSPKYCIFELDEYADGDKRFWLAHFVFATDLKVTRSHLKTIKREWQRFRRFFTAPIFAIRNDGDEEQWKRFVSRFGFKPTDFHLPCNNGVIRQLFISVVP